MALIPKMKKTLKILLPKMFPNAISQFPFAAAIQEVASSGNDVPSATMVRPIIASLTPRHCAILVALLTINSPPKTKHDSPKIISNKAFIGLMGV